MRKLLLVVLFAFAVPNPSYAGRYLLMQPNATSSPSIAISGKTVQVSGITPASEVILFTASIQSDSGILRQLTGAKAFPDTDGDGSVTYMAQRDIPLRSVWIAVDFSSGRYTVAGPANYTVRLLPFPTARLLRDSEGILGLFDHEQLSAEMLIVRPGEGAWRLRAFEGGTGDADRTRNGKLGLAVAEAAVIRGAPPPTRLKNGDVVAVIDPDRMEVFIVEIGP